MAITKRQMAETIVRVEWNRTPEKPLSGPMRVVMARYERKRKMELVVIYQEALKTWISNGWKSGELPQRPKRRKAEV